MLLTLLGTGFLVLGVSPQLFRPETAADLRADAVAALEGFRPPEGRLVGFAYIRPQSSISAKIGMDADRLARLRRIRGLAVGLKAHDRLALMAVLDLAEGQTKRAITKLEKAVELSPNESRFLTDLSASYLSSALEDHEPYHLFLALRTAERAMEVAPELKEAQFNRAVALERLFLKTQAVAAWRSLIKNEQEPGWFEESNAHLAAIQRDANAEAWGHERATLIEAIIREDLQSVRQIVLQSTQQVREWAEGELLGSWAEATLGRRLAEAEQYLTTLRLLGDELSRLSKDTMLADTVAVIDDILARRDAGETTTLARGHALYWEAMQRGVRVDSGRTMTSFEKAHRLLSQLGSPFQLWAEFGSALCNYHSAKYPEALARLASLQTTSAKNYPVLEGRTNWIFGLIHSDQGRFDLSLPEFRRSQSLFKQSRQIAYLGAVHRLLADGLFTLGQEQEAWKHLYDGLRTTGANLDPIRTLAVFEQAALAVRRAGDPRRALYFQNEGLSLFNKDQKQPAIAGSYALRAELYFEAGDRDRALAEIRAARALARRIYDGATRSNLEADISRIEGTILRSIDPTQAIERLTQALQTYRQTGYRFYLARTYFTRALSYIDIGDDDLAEVDLREGIDEVERQRYSLDEQLKVTFFDQAEPLFEHMLSLRLRNGDLDGAFAIAELSRARVLADLSLEEKDRLRPATLAELRAALPAGSMIVEYTFYGDRLLAFIIDRQESSFLDLSVGRKEIEKHISRLWTTRHDNDDWSRASTALYEVLVQPLKEQISGRSLVVFVPHGILGRVPFPALVNPRSRAYLIEEMAVTVAPSATLLLKTLRSSKTRERDGRQRMMIFGNPEFGREVAGGLLPTTYAGEEVKRLAALLPNADVISGDGATREWFLLGREYKAFHFAGHAVSNPEFPLLSRFIVAPDPKTGSQGSVFAHEIYRQKGWKADLVTLAACGTASGRASNSEGLEGLVRPFIAAGVPAVVGSLWDIRDRAASEFFLEFYRQAIAQKDSLEALRQTQIYFIHHKDGRMRSPDVWGGFLHFGAGVNGLEDALR